MGPPCAFLQVRLEDRGGVRQLAADERRGDLSREGLNLPEAPEGSDDPAPVQVDQDVPVPPGVARGAFFGPRERSER